MVQFQIMKQQIKENNDRIDRYKMTKVSRVRQIDQIPNSSQKILKTAEERLKFKDVTTLNRYLDSDST